MIQRTTLFAALLIAASSLPAIAEAQTAAPPAAPQSEADKRFRRGIELYGEGDFNAALIEFRRAYELDPRYQALYNIGETYFQLQDYANALKTLEQYLKDGGAKVSAERRDEVQKEIEKLRARVATIEVTTRAPGVEITVDDVARGRTPLTIVVSAGRRKVAANQPGKPPVVQVIDVAGGDTKKVTLEVADEPKEQDKPRSVPPAPWIVMGVLTAGAVVTGSLALGASSGLQDELAKRPGDKDAISSAKSKTFALALTTDILAGSALVMAGVSIYFTASALSSKKPEPRDAARLRWIGGAPEGDPSALVLSAGPRGFSLTGSF